MEISELEDNEVCIFYISEKSNRMSYAIKKDRGMQSYINWFDMSTNCIGHKIKK
jgi:hypothetical protein